MKKAAGLFVAGFVIAASANAFDRADAGAAKKDEASVASSTTAHATARKLSNTSAKDNRKSLPTQDAQNPYDVPLLKTARPVFGL